MVVVAGEVHVAGVNTGTGAELDVMTTALVTCTGTVATANASSGGSLSLDAIRQLLMVHFPLDKQQCRRLVGLRFEVVKQIGFITRVTRILTVILSGPIWSMGIVMHGTLLPGRTGIFLII